MKLSNLFKKLSIAGVLGSSLLLGACTQSDINDTMSIAKDVVEIGSQVKDLTTDNKPTAPERKVIKGVKVVDGDTLKYQENGQTKEIRLLLVDTPETVHPKLGVQPYGKEASNFTKKEILLAKKVELEYDPADSGTDKYGRELGYVYVDGKSLQELLLEKGLARYAYHYKDYYVHEDEYMKAEQKAKQKGVKIWSTKGYATDEGFNTSVIR